MKKSRLTFSKKILVLLLSSVGFTILFSFFFIHYLYSNLYFSIEESIIYQGQRTASHYHYGELSDEIIEKIQWYNIVSEYEIIVVDKLDDLSSYFPYKVNYESLINQRDLTHLENGKYVLKEGLVEEFDREIIGAIFPIKGDGSLIGFIYIYVPLAAIQDVFHNSIPILIVTSSVFFLLLFLIVNRFWTSIFNPLKKLQQQAVEVSEGHYSKYLEFTSDDEVGQLTKAFNKMSYSLGQQEKRKKEFTSNIVHELRTPLTYITGYTQALKHEIYTSPEEAEKYLMTIEKEAERLNKLINDLNELNHLQEDFYSIESQPIAIAQLLTDTIELFMIHISQKKLKLDLTIREDLIIIGDPQRIQQVFYNVLDNAVKYSEENNTININLVEDDNFVQFSVINQGTLIAVDDINRIGERFFRTDKARNRATGGTGLGLSIVKEIVRLHNGTFTIESSSSEGTNVLIHLPKWREEDYNEKT